jgi:diacylglycerol kinase family enzyme
MRAVLVHNPRAGGGDHRMMELVRELRCVVDWTVDYAHHLAIEEVLASSPDIVIVAGGDGTVGKVAKRCAGTETRVAVIPTGTANNIAGSLELETKDPIAAVHALKRTREIRLDLGRIRGHTVFVESFGVGAFAMLLRDEDARGAPCVGDARHAMAKKLAKLDAVRIGVEIDGHAREGEYLLATVMNARSFGPLLVFAPDAKMDDGFFDVVLVGETHRKELADRLAESGDEPFALPGAICVRGRNVRLRSYDRWAHIDDVAEQMEREVELRIVPAAVRVLVPVLTGS